MGSPTEGAKNRCPRRSIAKKYQLLFVGEKWIATWSSTWTLSLADMSLRIYNLIISFHITDLFICFIISKYMYFLSLMQNNFDAINSDIFYAYFLFAYPFESRNKEEMYLCVGLRMGRFLKHLLLWICDLLQNTRFKWLSGSFCLSRLYRIVELFWIL